MGATVLNIAARGSRLSRIQTKEALDALRPALAADTAYHLCVYETPGDRDKQTPLTDATVPDDFFTRDIDRALLDGRADLAVHSAKDLPKRTPDGLVDIILSGRDERDALVLRTGRDPAEPPRFIGTSSPRRERVIRDLFPGAETRPLRGTVDERIARLDAGEFDAIIVAACALERLGLAHRISRYLPYATAPLQGKLAIVVRESDTNLLARLQPLDFRRNLFNKGAPHPDAGRGSEKPQGPVTLFLGTNAERFRAFEPLLHWPMIRLLPRPLDERARAIEENLSSSVGVFFASPFAVRCFVEALYQRHNAQTMKGRMLLAVGPSTALELERMHLVADVIGTGFGGAASLAAQIHTARPGRYFYPCSRVAPGDERAAALSRAGIELAPCVFYENNDISPGPLPEFPIARVLFTSPSTVESYFTRYPEELGASREWIAIGPSTLGSLRRRGVNGICIA